MEGNNRLYISGLLRETPSRDIEDMFLKFGKITEFSVERGEGHVVSILSVNCFI